MMNGSGASAGARALVALVGLERVAGLLALVALEQRPQRQQLGQDAAGCPHVGRRRVVPPAQQQLRRAVPDGDHHAVVAQRAQRRREDAARARARRRSERRRAGAGGARCTSARLPQLGGPRMRCHPRCSRPAAVHEPAAAQPVLGSPPWCTAWPHPGSPSDTVRRVRTAPC